MESRKEPVLVDEFEVGLDRAKITKSAQIQLPESQDANQNTQVQADPDSPRSSSHAVVDSIKQKKHKAGIKIRRTLHMGRASDDIDLTTTAIVGGNEAP